MLYMIGLGLNDEKDLSINGLEAVKKCKNIYLENYTSRINFDVKRLEKLTDKKIILANRETLENNMDEFVEEGRKEDVALLIIGDPLLATTHMALMVEAIKKKIKFRVIHNASVINAIADTGLSMYNFGRVASIPFENKNIINPVETIKNNSLLGMHTLLLLDVKNGKYMKINEAISYLIENGMEDRMIVGCAGLGRKEQEIKYGIASKIIKEKFTQEPACVVVPGKLHFLEEEALENFKI